MKRTFLAVAILSLSFVLAGCESTKEVTLPQPNVNGQAMGNSSPQPYSAPPASSNQQIPVVQPSNSYSSSPSASSGNTYTVRRGDTLWSIASSQLGDGQRWRDIVAANPGLNPHKLAVGQQIVIP